MRRRSLLAAPLLAAPLTAPLTGCAERLLPLDAAASTDEARALLAASAAAHGLDCLSAWSDVSAGYEGRFASLVDRLQPELVDASRRAMAQDRLLLRDGLIGQSQSGPGGTKQVVLENRPGAPGAVRVWFDGVEALDRPRRDAAAVVADCYQLFLLGPMLLAGRWSTERSMVLAIEEPEDITVAGQRHACERLRVSMRPGLGLSSGDELVLWIDRAERLMRRVRFTLNGHVPTRGAVAETDFWGHFELGSGAMPVRMAALPRRDPGSAVRFASQYEERLLRPLPLDVHRWTMVGLDVNRGMDRVAVGGPAFTGVAARAANEVPRSVPQ